MLVVLRQRQVLVNTTMDVVVVVVVVYHWESEAFLTTIVLQEDRVPTTLTAT
jgi:hypothetical protein